MLNTEFTESTERKKRNPGKAKQQHIGAANVPHTHRLRNLQEVEKRQDHGKRAI